MKRSRDLAAGLLDTAFAALGTFLAGVLAVRELDVGLLAAYAVIASAAVFAMPLSRQLIYVPSQVAANVLTEVRVPVLREAVRRALPWSGAGVGVVVLVGATLFAAHGPAVATLALTAAAMVVVSPAQDHVRSCLHLAGLHLRAAVCSIVLAAIVGAAALAGSLLPLPDAVLALVPFGALTVANLLSLVVGILLLRSVPRIAGGGGLAFRDRSRFLLSEMAVQGAWLGCTYLVLLLVGESAVAALEAARVAAAPVFILSGALSTFLAPALLRRLNPDAPDRAGAVREVGVAVAVLAAGVLLWTVALALGGDLVALVLNKPFELSLTVARCVASSLEGIGALVSITLLALAEARAALLLSLLAAGVGLVGTGLLAPLAGPFSLPVAQAAGSAIRVVLIARSAGRGIDRLLAARPAVPAA